MERRVLVPSRVYLDVTNACQLSCRHCCTCSGAQLEAELSGDELLDVIEQTYAMGVTQLVISGGEPLLRLELDTLLAHARGLGLAVTLLTNGLLIDRAWAARLVELGVRPKISLDGVTAPTHDHLRGAGTFARTCAVLRRLVAAGAQDLCVHFTVHRRNFAELPRLPGLLAELGVPGVVIGTIKPSGRAAANAELLIPTSMVTYVHQKVRQMKQRSGIPVLSFSERGWQGFGCPATCNKLGITAQGRLTTCAFFGQDYLGGSVRQAPLAKLWRRHLEQAGMFVANPTCASCAALAECGGGCRARARYYHGDLNATDPYCCAFYRKQRFLEQQRDLLRAARRDGACAFA